MLRLMRVICSAHSIFKSISYTSQLDISDDCSFNSTIWQLVFGNTARKMHVMLCWNAITVICKSVEPPPSVKTQKWQLLLVIASFLVDIASSFLLQVYGLRSVLA